MKKTLSVIFASLACATAGAQTANFEGLTAALNMNFVSSSTKLELGDNDPITFDGLGKSGTVASVQAAYGFALANNVVLSVGGTYALNAPKVLSFSGEGFNSNGKAKNMASLFVEPGLVISDKTMVYGKLSYETAKLVLSSVDEDGASNNSKSVKGTGFGMGMRTMLNNNLFMQVEVKRIGYGAEKFNSTEPSFKTSATVGTIGIGYKF